MWVLYYTRRIATTGALDRKVAKELGIQELSRTGAEKAAKAAKEWLDGERRCGFSTDDVSLKYDSNIVL